MNLRRTVETLQAHQHVNPAVRRALDDALADGIHAQNLEGDRTTGHTTVLDDDGLSMPAVSDPTGETACNPDRARLLLAELDHLESRVVTHAGSLYDTRPVGFPQAVLTVWVYANHPTRPPRQTAMSRIVRAADRLADIDNQFVCRCGHPHRCPTHSTITPKDHAAILAKVSDANAPICAYCGQEPPCTARPTTVAGNLPEPRLVGRTCYDRIRRSGRPPSRTDLETLNRTGRWPKLKETA